jgi:hypothetical protein
VQDDSGIETRLVRIEHDAVCGAAHGLFDQILEQPIGRIRPLQASHILNVGRRNLNRHAHRMQLVRDDRQLDGDGLSGSGAAGDRARVGRFGRQGCEHRRAFAAPAAKEAAERTAGKRHRGQGRNESTQLHLRFPGL